MNLNISFAGDNQLQGLTPFYFKGKLLRNRSAAIRSACAAHKAATEAAPQLITGITAQPLAGTKLNC